METITTDKIKVEDVAVLSQPEVTSPFIEPGNFTDSSTSTAGSLVVTTLPTEQTSSAKSQTETVNVITNRLTSFSSNNPTLVDAVEKSLKPLTAKTLQISDESVMESVSSHLKDAVDILNTEDLSATDEHISESTPDVAYKNSNQSVSKMRKKKKTGNYKEYWCSYCNKHFRHKGNMQQHERSHTKERPFRCNQCGTTFIKSSHLLEHRRRHFGKVRVNGISQYECSMCNRCFHSKASLNVHSNIHSTALNFSCSKCPRKFRYRSSLDRHLKVHARKKDYACDFCQKAFYDGSDLKKHIATHTGLNKYECKPCDKSFRLASDLKLHILKRHAMCDSSKNKTKQINDRCINYDDSNDSQRSRSVEKHEVDIENILMEDILSNVAHSADRLLDDEADESSKTAEQGNIRQVVTREDGRFENIGNDTTVYDTKKESGSLVVKESDLSIDNTDLDNLLEMPKKSNDNEEIISTLTRPDKNIPHENCMEKNSHEYVSNENFYKEKSERSLVSLTTSSASNESVTDLKKKQFSASKMLKHLIDGYEKKTTKGEIISTTCMNLETDGFDNPRKIEVDRSEISEQMESANEALCVMEEVEDNISIAEKETPTIKMEKMNEVYATFTEKKVTDSNEHFNCNRSSVEVAAEEEQSENNLSVTQEPLKIGVPYDQSDEIGLVKRTVHEKGGEVKSKCFENVCDVKDSRQDDKSQRNEIVQVRCNEVKPNQTDNEKMTGACWKISKSHNFSVGVRQKFKSKLGQKIQKMVSKYYVNRPKNTTKCVSANLNDVVQNKAQRQLYDNRTLSNKIQTSVHCSREKVQSKRHIPSKQFEKEVFSKASDQAASISGVNTFQSPESNKNNGSDIPSDSQTVYNGDRCSIKGIVNQEIVSQGTYTCETFPNLQKVKSEKNVYENFDRNINEVTCDTEKDIPDGNKTFKKSQNSANEQTINEVEVTPAPSNEIDNKRKSISDVLKIGNTKNVALEVCDKRINKVIVFKVAGNKVGTDTIYLKTCHHCEKTCDSRNEYLQHLREHIRQKTFTCEDCKQTFSKWRNYSSHKCEEFNKKKKFDFICAHCDRTFDSEKSLQNHINAKKRACMDCSMVFCTLEELGIHKLTHLKYTCSHCCQKFHTRWNVNMHVRRVHATFRCDVCHKAFMNAYNLQRHKTQLHEKVWFKCDDCDIEFVSKTSYKSHQKVCMKSNLNEDIIVENDQLVPKDFAVETGRHVVDTNEIIEDNEEVGEEGLIENWNIIESSKGIEITSSNFTLISESGEFQVSEKKRNDADNGADVRLSLDDEIEAAVASITSNPESEHITAVKIASYNNQTGIHLKENSETLTVNKEDISKLKESINTQNNTSRSPIFEHGDGHESKALVTSDKENENLGRINSSMTDYANFQNKTFRNQDRLVVSNSLFRKKSKITYSCNMTNTKLTGKALANNVKEGDNSETGKNRDLIKKAKERDKCENTYGSMKNLARELNETDKSETKNDPDPIVTQKKTLKNILGSMKNNMKLITRQLRSSPRSAHDITIDSWNTNKKQISCRFKESFSDKLDYVKPDGNDTTNQVNENDDKEMSKNIVIDSDSDKDNEYIETLAKKSESKVTPSNDIVKKSILLDAGSENSEDGGNYDQEIIVDKNLNKDTCSPVELEDRSKAETNFLDEEEKCKEENISHKTTNENKVVMEESSDSSYCKDSYARSTDCFKSRKRKSEVKSGWKSGVKLKRVEIILWDICKTGNKEFKKGPDTVSDVDLCKRKVEVVLNDIFKTPKKIVNTSSDVPFNKKSTEIACDVDDCGVKVKTLDSGSSDVASEGKKVHIIDSESTDESSCDSASDDDSDGYEECSLDEVEAMVSSCKKA